MKVRVKKKAVYITFTLLALGIVSYGVFYVFEDTYHIDTIHLSNGNKIEIRAEACWEISQSIEYRLPGSSLTYRFGGTNESPNKLKFRALEAENSNLVAIVESTNPDVVLILHDFKSENSWPYRYDSESWKKCLERGEAMLLRMMAKHSNKNLVLSSRVPANRRLKVGP